MCFSFICTTCPVHLILLDFITVPTSGKGYKLWCSKLRNFSPAYVTSFPLYPNTVFSTIFMNTFGQYSSINMKYKVSHSCTFKITDKIMVLCFLILVFLDSKWEDKSSGLKSSRHSPDAKN
jgi:hypothetical protein